MDKKKKILFLPRYGKLGASSRYRIFQYLPSIEKENIDYDIQSLFDDNYLTYRYQYGHTNKKIILLSLIKRIKMVISNASKYNLLVIEKELLPYFPPFLEIYLKLRKIPYIVDYDDAVWHNYDVNNNSIIRLLLRKKIKTVMKNASVVVAGSEYIVNYAKKANAKKIFKIPTVIDTYKYSCKNNKNIEQFVVGWIGSQTTSKLVVAIDDVLKVFTDNNNAIVHLIGFDEKLADQLTCNYKIIKWDNKTEVDNICNFDVGIMPLLDSLFEKGKCGFKLIQYMGCAKPVIASPIGENNYIVDDGVNGFLVNERRDWLKKLQTLYDDKSLASDIGYNGYQKVQKNYSLEYTQKIYIDIINNFIK